MRVSGRQKRIFARPLGPSAFTIILTRRPYVACCQLNGILPIANNVTDQ
jgi:hypothetical protein